MAIFISCVIGLAVFGVYKFIVAFSGLCNLIDEIKEKGIE